MFTSKPNVFGIYKDRMKLDRAVDQLKSDGYDPSDISVMFPDQKSSREFAQEKHTKAPEGAATGAGTGLAVGGALGWLVGIGSLAIPGVGPFIAAGPIMTALAGAGVGGAVGTLGGALIGMGIPEYEAKKYENAVREGDFFLAIQGDRPDSLVRAREILSATGAEQISGSGQISRTDQIQSEVPSETKKKVDLKPGEEAVIGIDKIEKKRTA